MESLLAIFTHGGIVTIIALVVAFAFEAVNGFHDTANAVATVIYTHTLKPGTAVVLSGVCNALGVIAAGSAVAYSIVHLLPVELLVQARGGAALAMVLALLLGAIIWNGGTWYLGLPSSSSHALIGSILGVGLVHSGFGGVNWHKAQEVGISLLASPLIGFFLAGGLLLVARRVIRDPVVFSPPVDKAPPPWWLRGLLIFTCSSVSFAHGSNDGQKGMGLVMLVLIGLMPAYFSVDLDAPAAEVAKAASAAAEIDKILEKYEVPASGESADPGPKARRHLAAIRAELDGKTTLREVPEDRRWALHTELIQLRDTLKKWSVDSEEKVPEELVKALEVQTEYIPSWVILGVALALGIGTMVGWKRIVVTVGEKIGKAHLSYGQGACAELIAGATIGLFDRIGLPVSTTHVLSSGVAGTMWANGNGVQGETVRKIAMAWVLTLPATMILSGGIYAIAKLFV